MLAEHTAECDMRRSLGKGREGKSTNSPHTLDEVAKLRTQQDQLASDYAANLKKREVKMSLCWRKKQLQLSNKGCAC